jgi:hypothetical protein
MMNSNSNSTTSSTALHALYSEAELLIKKAEEYRARLRELPPNDPQRKVYEDIIRDLVERATRLSNTVYTTTTSSLK